MKIFWIVLAVIVVALAATSATNYFLQRRRQTRAERDGLVVYATVLAVEAMRGLTKYLDMRKLTLRVQEPDASPREVTLRTRVQPGQKLAAGMQLIVVLDPTSPQRVYPATPEAAKRVVLTGSRQERRMMQSHLRTPGRAVPRPPSGYQPPQSKIR